MDKNKVNKEFINPIDKDKITESPSTLPYAHHAGSPVIKPEDNGKQKNLSINAMEFQTDMQLKQIYEQMELLAVQAKKIQDRKLISERIYMAEIRFTPVINHIYHLYLKEEKYFLSLIEPSHWGKSKIVWIATVRLLADHTWDILDKSEDF